MEQERVPNFDKGQSNPIPAGVASSGKTGEGFSGTNYWASFSNVVLTDKGCDVTVTGISGSWWWVYAKDSHGNRLDWSWCTDGQVVHLKCDPKKIDSIRLAWQGGSILAAWTDIAWTTP